MSLRVFGGGGGGTPVTVGSTPVDFGAFPGDSYATATVTGQSGILSTSTVQAWVMPAATADNSVDEHLIAATMLDVKAYDIVAGTGFTIRASVTSEAVEPLSLPYRARHNGSGTVATDTGAYQGPVSSVGGANNSTLVGAYSIGWMWV
jgi:hypothetical protein